MSPNKFHIAWLVLLSCVAVAAAQSVELQDSNAAARPRGVPLSLESEWIPGSDVDLSTLSASLKLPILKVFGTPPPIVSMGVAFTDLSAPESVDFRGDLYEYSFGVSGVKRINQRWAVRTILGMDYATDHDNTSSDAWRFTGGAFAIYEKSPQLSWTFGALALGRSDLPVVPAIGAIWLPNGTTRVDLILPNPKVNFLISDDGQRQSWAYLGGGFNGNTWGIERPRFGNDALTYRDLRLVAGWESRPSAPVNAPYVRGRKYGVEVGYAFSRSFELERLEEETDLDDAFLLRVSTRY